MLELLRIGDKIALLADDEGLESKFEIRCCLLLKDEFGVAGGDVGSSSKNFRRFRFRFPRPNSAFVIEF